MDNFELELNDGTGCYDFFSAISEENSKEAKGLKEIKKQKWMVNNNFYLPISDSCDKLESGYYSVHQDARGNVGFLKQVLKSDELFLFSNNIMTDIIAEIEKFWSKEEIYQQNKILHRRGILLHGGPGNGKSCVIFQAMKYIMTRGGIALNGNCKPAHLIEALKELRKIESDRKIICILEDIDKIVREYGEDKLLALLDGEDKTNSILFLATTNEPESLSKALTARPKRFDRLYFIDHPNDDIRRQYIKHKIKDISDDQLDRYVKKTKGYSFASLAELLVSIICLDYTLDDALETLNGIQENKLSSNKYFNSKMGFNS
jgi:hypothetical protein